LNYPDYEVILVDDGSTDQTPEIARQFPSVRYIRQANHGLSAARNTGIRAATGEIVAFTDDDCRADEDWLYYLAGDLLRSDFAGIGGHNFLPPEDSRVAAAVAASPGGPAHVMLTDREAEHIPGCNMAFYKWALEEIGMFDPIFRKAGDDVDVCWRLQDSGRKIGFSAAGFVWHYRRSTTKAYLKQQAGYGEAEALLIGKHPDHFNSFGGGLWHGRIYASSFSGLLLRGAVIYHGIFGSGFFSTALCSRTGSAFDALHNLGISRPGYGSLVGAGMQFQHLYTLGCGWRRSPFGHLHRRGGTGKNTPRQKAHLVKAAGRLAFFPATNCSRLVPFQVAMESALQPHKSPVGRVEDKGRNSRSRSLLVRRHGRTLRVSAGNPGATGEGGLGFQNGYRLDAG
jgi:glycosyltransferase involved in cell wall biosynthesis